MNAMENKAMASVVWLAETGEDKFNLAEVMEYRVTSSSSSSPWGDVTISAEQGRIKALEALAH